jgi:hypothetical protein
MRSSLVAVTLAFSGCGLGFGPTHGELGVAEFKYDNGLLGCLGGCNAAEPLAARSSIGIWATLPDQMPDFTVSSSDDAIVSFTSGSTSTSKGQTSRGVRATAHAAGEAKLILTDMLGQVVDRLPVRVRDVARIELADRDDFNHTLTVMEGGGKQVQLDVYDARGERLRGAGGLDYAFEGDVSAPPVTLESVLSAAVGAIFVGTSQEYVNVKAAAGAQGSGVIKATSPAGASFDIPVTVVTEAAVTRVTLTGESSPTRAEGWHVGAEAFAGDERVYSPRCAWSMTETSGMRLASQGGESATVESTVTGPVSITCTIGSQSATRSATFQ